MNLKYIGTIRTMAVSNKLWLLLLFLVISAILVLRTVYRQPPRIIDLGIPSEKKLLKDWQDGNSIVLIRHAERCDQSQNTCYGPRDGITVVGSETAKTISETFKKIGVANADVYGTSTTRTLQTGLFAFGHVEKIDLPGLCDNSMVKNLVALKRPGQNLVLITHKSCIRKIEKYFGFSHPSSAPYTSLIFFHPSENSIIELLGTITSEEFVAMPKIFSE